MMAYHIRVGGTGSRSQAGWSASYSRTRAFGTILTPATLDWPAVNQLSLELDIATPACS